MKLVRILRSDVERTDQKLPGYEAAVLDAARFFDDRQIVIEEQTYLQIAARRVSRSHLVPLGDLVEKTLTFVGVTKKRVQAVTRTKDCGCQKRQQWLNQWGFRQQERLLRLANKAAKFYGLN